MRRLTSCVYEDETLYPDAGGAAGAGGGLGGADGRYIYIYIYIYIYVCIFILFSLYEIGLNGILADEMGLGKTLQVACQRESSLSTTHWSESTESSR